MTKYNLFDKIIDIEFTQEVPSSYGVSYAEGIRKPFYSEGYNKSLSFICPRSGIKPNVEIYVELLPNMNTNKMTLKIINMYSEVNIAKYKYVRVIAGYGSVEGKYAIFAGEILNCYIEKPNPEGTTVFSCVLGSVSQFLGNEEPVEITIPDKSDINTVVSTIATAFNIKGICNLPPDWSATTMITNGSTYTFANALTMQTWLKSSLDNIAEANKLSKLFVAVTDNTIYISPMTVKYIGQETIILDKITTAYFTGGNIVVTAPWNPSLTTGKLFQMDTKYFRGRMGQLFVAGDKKLFNPYLIKLSFSTTNLNSMEVNAVDTSLSMEEIK